MHNPTRRVRRCKQSPPSTRPSSRFSETGDIHLSFVPNEGSPTGNSSHARHRPAAKPDTLRGVMLVALIVVTIVLYFVLWEVERSSFAPVPKPNLTQSAIAAPSNYQPPTVQEPPVFPLDEDLNLFDKSIAVPSSKPSPSRTTPRTWPPPITRVPEEDVTENVDNDQANTDGIAKLSSFDGAYCDGPCRFLLPVRVGEQESKARVHFMQLLVLARKLNRTIVLPNVGKSRMSACSEWSFSAYYDTDGFTHGRDAPDSPLAIDLDMFAKWIHERPASPNGFLVSMGVTHRDRRGPLGTQTNMEDVPFIVEKTEIDPKILSCLKPKLAGLRSSLPEAALAISFDSRALKMEMDTSSRLVHLLSSSIDLNSASDFDLIMEPAYMPQYTNTSHLSLADVDVLILDYDLRHPLFAPSSAPLLANFNLHYAPALYDLADRLSENLGPFLAVHWRMENVPVQNLAWCAASLVSTLQVLLQDEVDDDVAKKTANMRYVWLATDHPRPLHSLVDDGMLVLGSGKDGYGPLRKSSTFKGLSIEHDDAIGILAEAFQPGGDLDAWKLTDLAEQLRRYPYVEGKFGVNEKLLNDSGVFGILDKLVTAQARVFVSGSKDCSKISSFSKQVIEARQETFEAEGGKGAVRNVVEYFGNW